MLTLLSLSAITKDSTNHSLILPTLCLIFHVCLAYSIDSATTLRMILPVSENVFCFGKERNSKTIKIVNYVFGEIWTIGIMNLILKDKTDSVMPESFVVSQKCAALIVRGFFFTFFTHANAKKKYTGLSLLYIFHCLLRLCREISRWSIETQDDQYRCYDIFRYSECVRRYFESYLFKYYEYR